MQCHWLSVLYVLSAVLLADLATPPAPLWGDIRVKHEWNSVPANWEYLGPPPATTTIDLHIALKPHRENALIDALHEVSDPRHQKYGAHLSKEQVAELVAPHRDTLEIVHSWLERHGISSSSISTSHGGGWLTITGVPVSQADELLCASYQVYRHTGTNGTEVILRTISYALPAALHAHVKTVAPTTHFPSPRTPLQTSHSRSGEEVEAMVNATSRELVKAPSRRERDFTVTPPFLRWLYKTQTYTPVVLPWNILGILSLEDSGYPNQPDLTRFLETYREDAQYATFKVALIKPVHRLEISPTASLSMQYAEAMAYPILHTFYDSGGHFEWSPDGGVPSASDSYLQWFYYLLNRPNLPQTISLSYYQQDSDFPQDYAEVMCNLFAILGARGVSILVASGDEGVGSGNCIDSSGIFRFIPTFPASCPWVTGVGGTRYYPEVAASRSGGGFSLYFPRPRYQDGVVPPFLGSLGTEYADLYRPDGRGIPDISAQAEKFSFILGNTLIYATGTGCATPIVAGVVSLLNNYLLASGRSPLGFLNPWLYGQGRTGFNDITVGSNPGCNTQGFLATVGWDPVTGLGTPDFVKLLHILAT